MKDNVFVHIASNAVDGETPAFDLHGRAPDVSICLYAKEPCGAGNGVTILDGGCSEDVAVVPEFVQVLLPFDLDFGLCDVSGEVHGARFGVENDSAEPLCRIRYWYNHGEEEDN